MTTATKPAPRPLSAEERERRARANAERRPVLIGFAGTVLVHLLLFLLAPYMKPKFSPELALSEEARRAANEREIMLQLAPEEPDRPPFKFVEVNPDAPEIDPGKTDQTGSKNQKVAQPEPGKDETEKPKTEGKLEESTAIVTGLKAEPMETPPPGGGSPSESTAQMQATAAPGDSRVKQAETPLPGLEKIQGDNPEGIATNVGDDPKNAKQEIEKKVEGQKDPSDAGQPQIVVNSSGVPATNPGRPGPRPRPKLQQVRPAVLADQRLSTSNVGVTAVNSKLSAYGEYMEKFIETVEAQWNRVLDQSKIRPPTPSHVRIKFRLGKDGQIVEVMDVEEDAGKQGTYACRDAITGPAPYEKWTPDMIAFLGDDVEITFTFYYQ